MTNPLQKLIAVQAEAAGLMREHGLLENGWRFEFSNTQHIMGDCSHSTKTIRFSKHYIMSDPKQITDTLLHEIAHALVEPRHGHDITWKRMAMFIGADPYSYPDEMTAKAQVRNTAKPNYRMKCSNPDCDWQVDRFRLRRSLMSEKRDARCPHCHAKVEFFKLNHK
jgi:predicted SprT family Zn-dependent metalloprotease